MEQYIPKAAVVAEIERLKSIQLSIFSKGETKESCCDSLTCISVYNEILSFLDTFEVKEVDLEKEINKYISDNFFGSQTLGFFANRTKEEPNDEDIALVAKYFFELGLKAQKG